MTKVLMLVPESTAGATCLKLRVEAFEKECPAANITILAKDPDGTTDAVICFGLVPMLETAKKLALEKPEKPVYVVTGSPRNLQEESGLKNLRTFNVPDDSVQAGMLAQPMNSLGRTITRDAQLST